MLNNALQVGDGAGVPDACPYSDGSGGEHNPEWFGGHSSRKIYRCNRCPGNAYHPKRHPCIIIACPDSSPPQNCPWSDFPPQWEEVDSLVELLKAFGSHEGEVVMYSDEVSISPV